MNDNTYIQQGWETVLELLSLSSAVCSVWVEWPSRRIPFLCTVLGHVDGKLISQFITAFCIRYGPGWTVQIEEKQIWLRIIFFLLSSILYIQYVPLKVLCHQIIVNIRQLNQIKIKCSFRWWLHSRKEAMHPTLSRRNSDFPLSQWINNIWLIIGFDFTSGTQAITARLKHWLNTVKIDNLKWAKGVRVR